MLGQQKQKRRIQDANMCYVLDCRSEHQKLKQEICHLRVTSNGEVILATLVVEQTQ